MINPAPIAVFTYNRLQHAKNTIECLQKNLLAEESYLFIFSDAPKIGDPIEPVESVRAYLGTIQGFRKVCIIERERNYGLGNNIIDGVNNIVNKFGKVIVLEDDLITSPFFLKFMNEALQLYEQDPHVFSVHGYVYPLDIDLPETFFIRGADCLGWGTWKRAWDLFQPDGSSLLHSLQATKQTFAFDFNGSYPYTQMLRDQVDGKNNSWAVRWYASSFLLGGYTLYPGRSLVFHSGGDGTGTNTGFDNMLDVELSAEAIKVARIEIAQNEDIYLAFSRVLRELHRPGILYRIKRKFKMVKGKFRK
jgi:hypothetical protein